MYMYVVLCTRSALAAAALEAADVLSFVVGIGRQERLRLSELNALASDPDWSHRYVISDFDSLKFIHAKIAKTACDGNK